MEWLMSSYHHLLQYVPANLRAGIIALIIFIFFLLLGNILSNYIIKIIVRLTSRDPSNMNNKIAQSFQKPLRYFIVILGTYWALRYLPLSAAQNIFIYKIFRSSIIILIAWGFYELVGIHSAISDEIKAKLKIDDILIPFFSKVIRFIIVALAIVLFASEWNYDINGFIAGLGLGGLAFAFAAKDALANIFGGIVIIMEKPFSIGDWVSTPSVEGTVEDISFRSTRFRTFAQALVTVPNSTLANEAITNWTRMGKRRLTFSLGLTYQTPGEKIEICVKRIKNMLIDHPQIHNETILVNFDKFSESSLDIFLYCFTNTTVWKDFLDVRQDVNLKIMNILKEEDVSMAFPSRSIYIETGEIPNNL
jgi:MscS family membrane protein